MPVANANGIATSNAQNNLTAGASAISLRGFDASATLVLLDGRRVATIPDRRRRQRHASVRRSEFNSAAAIESIEILKDGASTTYGADAVAGVVNIKLRHDYRGAEATIEYGNTLDKDNGEFNASLLFGIGDDRTNVSGVLNYYHRNAIFTRDRGNSNFTFGPSTSSNPGNFQVSRAAVIAAGVSPDQLPDGDIFFAAPPDFSNGDASPSAYLYTPFRSKTFNFNRFAGSFPESERYGGFVNFDHKVFGEQLRIYGDFSYQNVQTINQLAPSPTDSFQSPGQTSIAIPPHAPGALIGDGPTYEETGLMPGAFNPFNPFQQIISGTSRYRLADFPNRVVKNTTDAFVTTLGLKGDKLFDGSWGYDGAFRYSEIKDRATGNLFRLPGSIGS